MNRTELAAAADVDYKTLATLEDGVRWPRDKSRAKLESALGWKPGSLKQIRAGETPVELASAAPPAAEEPLIVHATGLLWKAVRDLADHAAHVADSELQTKARQVVLLSVDILTDMLLASTAAAQSRELLEDMFDGARTYTSLGRVDNSEVLSSDTGYWTGPPVFRATPPDEWDAESGPRMSQG